MIVLITENLYLRAEKVQSITVTEDILYDRDGDPVFDPKNKIVVRTYSIGIDYELTTPNSHGNTVMHTNLSASSKKHCNETMKALIEQVRVQDPDNMMIDGLIEKYFCGKVDEDDRRTETFRRVRKTKRRDKKVP